MNARRLRLPRRWSIGTMLITRTVFKIALLTIAVLVAVVGISAAVFFWHITPSVHEFSVDANAQITEEVAIEYSRKALALDGRDSPDMHPVKWTDWEFDHYARNPNWCRVYWETDDLPGWDFKVNIEKTGSKITCSIYRPI